MSALFIILILFFGFGHQNTHLKCPSLWPETIPKWGDQKTSIRTNKNTTLVSVGNKWTNTSDATVTVEEISSERYQIGTTTDENAIEHNKRVRECRTLNGDF